MHIQSKVTRTKAAAFTAAGTLALLALNPLAALAHEEEPLPLPETTTSGTAGAINTEDAKGLPGLLVAGIVLLAALAVGTVIVSKFAKTKNTEK